LPDLHVTYREAKLHVADALPQLTRLTNAFSKKLGSFCAAVALNFTYCNFCKSNIAVWMTPAQAAGIEANRWVVAELVERCGE
jgi:hypothetical protein